MRVLIVPSEVMIEGEMMYKVTDSDFGAGDYNGMYVLRIFIGDEVAVRRVVKK